MKSKLIEPIGSTKLQAYLKDEIPINDICKRIDLYR